VDAAQRKASEIDMRAHWDAHGTCSLPRSATNPAGKLNELLGVAPRLLPLPY
jgi:hypothetical protein